MTSRRRHLQTALSMVELLIVIVVIGIIATVALPSISNLRGVAKKTTAIQNAKSISQMSSALAALGVAHVISPPPPRILSESTKRGNRLS